MSKLNPTSMPPSAPPIAVPSVTLVNDCAWPAMPAVNAPVVVFMTVPLAPAAASATVGTCPPT